jgi:hypothetical protein
MTSEREKKVGELLAEAWNHFIRMEGAEPGHPDDTQEFKFGIHLAQMVLAHRVARRADPETWGPFQ